MEPSTSTRNPFSAAAVSGGRLPYFFTEPSVEKDLLHELDRQQWVGQIVGPHGSGKTTLTHHLWTYAQARFPSLVQVTIRGSKNVQRRVTGGDGPCLFVVDGIERLSLVDRWLLIGRFSCGGAQRRGRAGRRDGLLVTCHRALPWLPKVFETSFDEVLLNRVTKELLWGSIRIDIHDGDDDVFSGRQWKDFSRALVQRHGSNGREILMEMYDRYEAAFCKKHVPIIPLPLSKAGVEN